MEHNVWVLQTGNRWWRIDMWNSFSSLWFTCPSKRALSVGVGQHFIPTVSHCLIELIASICSLKIFQLQKTNNGSILLNHITCNCIRRNVQMFQNFWYLLDKLFWSNKSNDLFKVKMSPRNKWNLSKQFFSGFRCDYEFKCPISLISSPAIQTTLIKR